MTLLVRRGNEEVVLGPVRPRKDDGVYRLGFLPKGEGLPLPAAAWESVRLTALIIRDIGAMFGSLVRGEGHDTVAGPVGIVQESSRAVHSGVVTYAEVLALISINLALLNLLPLLPLDGGHIAFSIVESLRGRAIPRVAYERFSAVGLALVLLLFFIGLSNDVGRLNGG